MEIYNLTVHEVVELLKSKNISVKEVLESIFNRIEKIDDKIKAYITVLKEESYLNADKIQKKIMSGEKTGTLAGVCAGIKDNICTEGILTTCASKMLYNFKPAYNAEVINRIIDEDAIIVGKLNMDEFAMGGSNENSYFFYTKNPWDKERVPGGSSGGAAACVASDEAFFALGSDTGGSIRLPASFCGVVGMKPTYGRVSRYGLVAFSSSLEQIGPITKDVKDCAIIMNIISGHDYKDSTSSNNQVPDYTKFLVNDIKNLRIGIPKEYLSYGISEDVKKAIVSAVNILKDMGAVCDECSLPLFKYAVPAYYIISSAEASSNLARYDGIKYGYRADVAGNNNLDELIVKTRTYGFGNEVKKRILLGTFVLSSGYYEAYYKKALKVKKLIKDDFEKCFEKFDVIVGPTSPTTAYKIGEKIKNPLDMYMMDIYTVGANIAGLPAISIPCGFDSSGLPIGLQIIGKEFDEASIIKTAYAFEQNTNFHLEKPDI